MKTRFHLNRHGLRSVAFAFAFMALWPLPEGQAAGNVFDFRPGPASAKAVKSPKKTADVLRCHAIEAKTMAEASEIMVGDILTVKLFDDVEFQVYVREREPAVRGTDPVSFLGSTEGAEGPCNAVLVAGKDGLDVDVQTMASGKSYRVYSRQGTATVYENAPATQKHACGTKPLPAELLGDGTPDDQTPQKPKGTPKAAGTYVDTLLVFDRAASSWVSQQGSDVESFAATAVAKMNTVLANTGLDTSFRYRLAGTHVLSGNGGSDLEAVLDAVTDGTTYKGIDWSTIRTVRNSKGADIVSILIDIGDTSQLDTVTTGIGHCPKTGVAYSFMEDYTFNVCAVEFVAQDHTMTHETGHNLGCGHADNVNTAFISPGPGVYSYSSGYHFTASNTRYFTIMAYNYDGYGNIYQPCPYFSSPNYSYNGVAVGNSTHDNTRTIRENFATAAAFRDEPSTEGNDDFSSATPISGASGSVTGSNAGATMQTGEPRPSARSSVGASVWYRWTAPSGGTATFDTTGSSFDTVLGIYTGSSVSSLSEVASNDDIGSGNTASKTNFTAVAGTTYRIAVYGYGGATGTIALKWSLETPSAGNDDFSSATAISGASGSVTGSNAGATMQTGEPRPSARSSVGASVWYRWTAPSGGTATFDTTGSSFDTVLGIYTGSSVSSLSEVASNDDIGSGNTASKTNFTAVAGTTYRIAVYGYGGATGSIALAWSLADDGEAKTISIPAGSTSGSCTIVSGGEKWEIPDAFPDWIRSLTFSYGTGNMVSLSDNKLRFTCTAGNVTMSASCTTNDTGSPRECDLRILNVTAGTTKYRIHIRQLATTTPAPTAPTSISATTTLTNGIRVTWSGGSGATSYNLWRGLSSTRSAASKIATGVTSPYLDASSALVAETTYYYWVEAVNSAGSAFSGSDWGIKVAPSLPIGTPRLSAEGTDDAVELSWAGDVTNAAGFAVWRADSLGGSRTRLSVAVHTNRVTSYNTINGVMTMVVDTSWTATDTTAVPGEDYWYWVQATNRTESSTSAAATDYRRVVLSIGGGSSAEFPAEGDSTSRDITANASWRATTTNGWLTLSPSSGSGNGTLRITASANDSTEVRPGSIVVTAAPDTDHPKRATISVTQGREPEVLPDMVFCQWEDWPSSMFLSPAPDVMEETTTFVLGSPIYLHFGCANHNEAGIAVPAQRIAVRIADENSQTVAGWTYSVDALEAMEAVSVTEDNIMDNGSGGATITNAGTYTVSVTLDYDDAIAESDESDNTCSVTFVVEEAGRPNLEFFRPDEWPATAYLAASADATTAVTAFAEGDSVYVKFAYRSAGEASGGHRSHVLVQNASGAKVEEWWHSRTNGLAAGGGLLCSAPIEQPMPAGTYTVTITLDSNGDVAETDETDNTVVLHFTVENPTQTVTFDPNGGTCAVRTKTYAIGSTYTNLPTATLTNHTFAGWWTAAVGGSQIMADTPVTTDPARTFYAHWTAEVLPDMVFCQWEDWPSSMFLSPAPDVMEETTTFVLGSPIYLHFGCANHNEAGIAVPAQRIAVRIADENSQTVAGWTYSVDALEAMEAVSVTEDNIMDNGSGGATITNAGTYTVSVTLDYDDAIAESDESDNTCSVTFVVEEAGRPNLEFFRPDEWPATAYLAASADATTAVTAFAEGDSVYVKFAYRSAGEASGGHRSHVLVQNASGAKVEEWWHSWTNGLAAGVGLLCSAPIEEPMPAGTYTVTITLDSDGNVAETDESDNTVVLRFTVENPGAPQFRFGTAGGIQTFTLAGGRTTTQPVSLSWADASLQITLSGGTYTTTLTIQCHPNPGAARAGTLEFTIDGTEYAVDVVQDGFFGIFDWTADNDTGLVQVRWMGEHGKTYTVQRAQSLDGPWSAVGTLTAPADGPVSFEAAMPGRWTGGFFRLSTPE